MRSLFVLISLIIPALVYGQDLLPKQAPIDRRSKTIKQILLSDSPHSEEAPVDKKMNAMDSIFFKRYVEKEELEEMATSSPDTNVKFHKVKKGETLPAIARKYHTTVEQLCRLNNISKTVALKPGQILRF